VSFFDEGHEPAAQPGSTGGRAGVADVTHEGIRDQLSECLDDSLPERDRERVEEHIRSCGSCRAYERTLRATVRGVASLPRERAPDSARERLRQIAGD
jgi:anti-sigma factor RsiW